MDNAQIIAHHARALAASLLAASPADILEALEATAPPPASPIGSIDLSHAAHIRTLVRDVLFTSHFVAKERRKRAH